MVKLLKTGAIIILILYFIPYFYGIYKIMTGEGEYLYYKQTSWYYLSYFVPLALTYFIIRYKVRNN